MISQVGLKFAADSYFKQLFQNLRPELKYSKNRVFVTSHFGTLLSKRYTTLSPLLRHAPGPVCIEPILVMLDKLFMSRSIEFQMICQ